MAKTLTYKILEKHLVDGRLEKAQPIGIKIDQTLTQDATGTTAFLLFESMGIERVKTELSVSYHRPQYEPVRPGKPQRPSLSSKYCRKDRRIFFPAGQRNLSSGSS